MAAYRRVYDSRHLQTDCKDPGSGVLFTKVRTHGFVRKFCVRKIAKLAYERKICARKNTLVNSTPAPEPYARLSSMGYVYHLKRGAISVTSITGMIQPQQKVPTVTPATLKRAATSFSDW